jgi:ABC-type transport system involved in multi-copper enzyme maturation permease subunit
MTIQTGQLPAQNGGSWLRRWTEQPNPVWVRELRQSARLQRTPIVLALITATMTLLVCSVGGTFSVAAEPAKVGVALYHTFFSLAFALVTWVGPAVAASTVASERSGRTWEALLLSGLHRQVIARGKFLAALTYISMYVVMLAPVGALPFLFGGVTATEVLAAFALLLLIGVVCVAFGLAVSSKLSSPAVAIVVTLLIAIPASMALYVALGPILSIAVHDLWPGVPAGPPVWLPTAYARADFGSDYLVLLGLVPLATMLLPAWLLYEITVANMADPSDDGSSGLRRWFLAAAPMLTITAIAFCGVVPGLTIRIGAVALLFSFLLMVALLFCGEPLGPSRRVLTRWELAGTSALKRYLGPGILQANSLLLALGLACFGLLTAALAALTHLEAGLTWERELGQLLVTAGYLAAFFVFVVGFASWVRAGSISSVGPRILLLVVLFLATAGPWIGMAIAGVLSEANHSALLVASPSPTFVLVLIDAVGKTADAGKLKLLAGAMCAAAWALVGVGLFVGAIIRVRRLRREQAESEAEFEALLRAEDAEAQPAARA